jgi:predicted dehydrogenase
MKPLNIAIVGCGNISDAYLNILPRFPEVRVLACSDLDLNRARSSAEKHGVSHALTPEEVYAHPDIQIVLNLTTPEAHASVALAALRGGKSVYNEKPLALDLAAAQEMLSLARDKGLRVGCAPDTVLGAGIQTCRGLIDSGLIGEPIAATAFMTNHGHESWHPNPYFYYQPGGGPMFDMGPYYLSALVTLMGGISRVSAMARATFPERIATSKARNGERIPVNTPTHVAGTVGFENGAIGTVITSFDIWGANLPRIEVHGTEGSLSVPDPNTFGGPVRVKVGAGEWQEVPLTHPYSENYRGLGVVDMARAIVEGGEHRASGALAYHVLEVMQAFLSSSQNNSNIEIASRIARPSPMPTSAAEAQP